MSEQEGNGWNVCFVGFGMGSPPIKAAEDERTLDGMDINPVSHGHLIILTRRHVEPLFEMTGRSCWQQPTWPGGWRPACTEV